MLKRILFLLFAVCSLAVYGQNEEVKGKVVDDINDPLPGVSVSIKGTTRGTITDVDGNYSIEVSRNQTLVFSLVGMTPQEVV